MGCRCMCDVQTCFLASSSEKEKDVGRISEKYCLLADLSGCCACKQGWGDCQIAPGSPESCKEAAAFSCICDAEPHLTD